MAITSNFPTIRPSLNLDFANARALDPRITFGRASAATYYDGKTVAKAEENLVTGSNSLSGGTEVTIAANSGAAPDGNLTALLATPTTSLGWHAAGFKAIPLEIGKDYIFSFYVKTNGYSKLSCGDLSSMRFCLVFDLLSLTISGAGGTDFQSSGVTDVGNGWLRCWVKVKQTVSGLPMAFGFTPFPTGGTADGYGRANFTGDGVSGAYFWGLQVEQRSQVTAYTPTTTQPITNYIPVLQTALAGVPRFDHNPVTGESLGLLVEEQRTNLLTYSEQFDNAPWSRGNTTVEPNSCIAPDGQSTADKLVVNGVSSNHSVYRAIASTSGTYTASIYLKKAGYSRVRLYLNDSVTGDTYIVVDLDTETITNSAVNGSWSANSSSLTKCANGWLRLSVTGTQGAGTSVAFILAIQNNAGSGTYQGDGYSGIYVWGAQLEAGALPTSYIKTEASQVTRAADSASMTGANFSSWYRQDEGTIFVEAEVPGAPSGTNYEFFNIGDGNATGTNSILSRVNNGTARVMSYGAYQGVAQFTLSDSKVFPEKSFAKVSLSYKTNEVSASVSAGAPLTDTSVNPPVVNSLYLGGYTQRLNGHVKRFTFYPKAFPNNIQALTA